MNQQLEKFNHVIFKNLNNVLKNPWKIIVSDDDTHVHTVTDFVFQEFKFENKPLNLINAYSGKETKKLIKENPDTALILLDVVMEEENTGLELVKYIREELKNKFVRIIIRTGNPGMAPEGSVILDYDINDYKDKSLLSSNKLITAVIACLRSFKSLVTIALLNNNLENLVLERTYELKKSNVKLSEANDKMKRELEMAKKIQEAIIPKIFPESNKIDIAAHYEFMEELGGDYYDVISLENNKLALLIVDVSGHGTPSALITAMAKMTFYNNAKKNLSTSQVMNLVNSEIFEALGDFIEYFLTAFYAIIDLENWTLEYTNAGHNGGYLLKQNTNNLIFLRTKTTCIGLMKELNSNQESTKLHQGDKLILFTDGLPEAKDKEDHLLGRKKFEEIILEHKNLSANNLIKKIIHKLDDFVGSTPPQDDKTILIADIISNSGGKVKVNLETNQKQ